jgi:hypothetical protein
MLQAAFEAGDTIVVDAAEDGTLKIERATPPAKRQTAKAGR